jgi:hypothetical protein
MTKKVGEIVHVWMEGPSNHLNLLFAMGPKLNPSPP